MVLACWCWFVVGLLLSVQSTQYASFKIMPNTEHSTSEHSEHPEHSEHTSSHNKTLQLLLDLPASYKGPTKAESAPYGVIGTGEGLLAAHLAQSLVGSNFVRSGTQFVLFSPDVTNEARVYTEISEVAGAQVRGIATGGPTSLEHLDVLVPEGAFSTYHYLQYLAYATGHKAQAEQADVLLHNISEQCRPQNEQNPARDLAWQLWDRTPLLIAAADADGLPHAWQSLLARMGKTLALVACGDPLLLASSAFEARHERGDGRLALILGDLDAHLQVTREVLETRVDEVLHLPYLGQPETHAYVQHVGLWYFGAWVAFYLAEHYKQSSADSAVLLKARQTLTEQQGQ